MILMRHGECFPNYTVDPGLTFSGEKDIERKVETIINNFNVMTIICSHKKRAIETKNKFITRLPSLEVFVNKDIREVSPFLTEEEKRRVDHMAENFFLKNINNNSLIIISHMNFLTHIISKIAKEDTTYFKEYGSAIEITSNNNIKILY